MREWHVAWRLVTTLDVDHTFPWYLQEWVHVLFLPSLDFLLSLEDTANLRVRCTPFGLSGLCGSWLDGVLIFNVLDLRLTGADRDGVIKHTNWSRLTQVFVSAGLWDRSVLYTCCSDNNVTIG
jgi:hypothetical protein